MSKSLRAIRSLIVLVAIAWAGSAAAQGTFSLQTGSGGQGQIGAGLPLPIQPSTTAGTGMGAPIGTGTMFPPLLIPGTGGTVMQTGTMAPLTITIPKGVFKISPPAPKVLGVALNNPTVFQVTTRLSFSGPGTTGTFMAGGRTGAMTTSFPGTPTGATARYSKSAAQFGGPGQTNVVVVTPVRVWAHKTMAPCKHPFFGGADPACASQLVGAHPDVTVAAGGPVGFMNSTPGLPAPMSPNVAYVSVPASTGLVATYLSVVMSGVVTNMATSFGFPWTTGMLTLSQPSALGGAEVFTVTGADSRTAMGAGTLSLVAGALSKRTLSGPNANRTWARYVLPEPGAMLGAGAALAALGLCHGLVRRRSG